MLFTETRARALLKACVSENMKSDGKYITNVFFYSLYKKRNSVEIK